MASIYDRFRNLFSNKNLQRTAEAYNRAVFNYMGNNIVFAKENDETYINHGYRRNATIYSIVIIITKACTTIPFVIYEKKSENDLKRYKSITSSGLDTNILLKAEQLRKSALVELDDTELHQLLDRPNPAQSYNSWMSEIVAFGKLTGNRYIYGIGPETGGNASKYKELYVLPSQLMEIVSGGLMNPVKAYRLDYKGAYDIPADDILHIKDFNPDYTGTGSHLYGQSPLKAGLRTLTTNNEAVTTGVKYLQNQTARGVLYADEGDLNEVQAQALKDKFRRSHQGSNNAGDVIITPKKLSLVNFGLAASDLSLIEQYNASIKDLANIYSVPAVLLNNTESSTYNNVKEAKKSLYQNCVMPEMIKIRDELNRWLAPKYGEKLYIDFDFTVIPELQEEMDKVVQQLSQSWWLTMNEKRAAMNYGADQDDAKLNDYYIPANLIPLNAVDDTPVEPLDPDIDKYVKDIKVKYSDVKSKVPGMTDVFTTRGEAEDRAEELGGRGFHRHQFDGEDVYMPFESHEQYESAIERQKEYHDMDEDDKYHYGEPHEDDEDKYHHEDEDKAPKISPNVETALRRRVEEHNEEHGDKPSSRATYGMLAASFRRGVGAYRTNPSSVRPNVRSEEQWAFGRVSGLLYALRNNRFRRTPYDTDLLPEEHPLSSKEKSYQRKQMFDDYPQSATNNAKRVKNWIDKYGRDEVDGMTRVGLARMNMLIERRPYSLDMVKRTFSFLSRTKGGGYNKINPEFKDTPWKDKGYVAYLGWGGEAMLNWSENTLDKIDE